MLPVVSRLSPRVLSSISSLMDTDDFARIIAETTDEQLEAGMQTKLRQVIIGEIVSRMKDEFVASRAGDLDAVIEFEIKGRPDGGVDTYQIRVANSTCEVATGKAFAETATSKIEIDAVNFLRMATGNVSGIDLYIGGKLKWDGGMMMLTRLTRMFNIPNVATEASAA